MGKRWTLKEEKALIEFRHRLKDELDKYPPYPDVVGDRRILRFLRGKQYDINESVKLYSAFLNWRIENKIDDIRNQILYGGIDNPLKFPFGKVLLELAPQIVISAKALDRKGRPLVLEQYSFNPNDVFTAVTTEEYLLFLMYTLEYRALVIEQMSHEAELKYTELHPDINTRVDGYGVVLLNYCIRDLQGVGLSHLTGKGKALIEAAMNLGIPNYPEYLGKCCMINAPWIFNSAWYFIKAFLDEITLAKISISGSKYIDILKSDMELNSIPRMYGGNFEVSHESFPFDTSTSGPFYCKDIVIPNTLPIIVPSVLLTTNTNNTTTTTAIDNRNTKRLPSKRNSVPHHIETTVANSNHNNYNNNHHHQNNNINNNNDSNNSLLEDIIKLYGMIESLLLLYPFYSTGILIMFAIFPSIMYRYVILPFLILAYINYVDNIEIKF